MNWSGRLRARPWYRPYYVTLDPFILWNGHSHPIDWDGEFGRSAPLYLEIGYGNGEALVRRAVERPEVNHVGLEISWGSTKRALRRIAQMELGNVRLMQVDANLAVSRLFRPESLDRIIGLFPIPWPKDKHEKRRLFSSDFLKLMNGRLKPDGKAGIVTDFHPFYQWVLEQLPDTGFGYSGKVIEARFDTKYERKWRETGQQEFYELLLEKERHIPAPDLPEVQLQVYRIKGFDPARFSPQSVEGQVTVRFKDVVYDPEKRLILVQAFISEGRMVQDVFIKIQEQGESWRLSLAQKVNVVMTEGVKMAMNLALEAARAASDET